MFHPKRENIVRGVSPHGWRCALDVILLTFTPPPLDLVSAVAQVRPDIRKDHLWEMDIAIGVRGGEAPFDSSHCIFAEAAPVDPTGPPHMATPMLSMALPQRHVCRVSR